MFCVTENLFVNVTGPSLHLGLARRTGTSSPREEEEEVFITSGNWKGKHNSLSRGAGADHYGIVPRNAFRLLPSKRIGLRNAEWGTLNWREAPHVSKPRAAALPRHRQKSEK